MCKSIMHLKVYDSSVAIAVSCGVCCFISYLMYSLHLRAFQFSTPFSLVLNLMWLVMKGFEKPWAHPDREQLDPVVKHHTLLPALTKTRVLKNTPEQFIGISAAKAACLVLETPSSVWFSEILSLLIFQPMGEPSQQMVLGIEHPFAQLLFSRKEPFLKTCTTSLGKEKCFINMSSLNIS